MLSGPGGEHFSTHRSDRAYIVLLYPSKGNSMCPTARIVISIAILNLKFQAAGCLILAA
jgi:hypothetical protein